MTNLPEVITLDNGLRVILEDIPFVRSVSFGIWVKNGSRNEDESTNGISHFIEHMLFKGTKNRSAKDIADVMDEIGGQVNAYTSKEHTCYYTRTLDTHFDIVLDVLSDMFFNSRFDQDDIQKERNVILEEISMYEDTPEDIVHELLQYAVYKAGSLGLSILGTEESIGAFDNKRFKDYMENHYVPESTVIAVAGNLSNCDALRKIRETFGSFKGKSRVLDSALQHYKPAFIKKEKDIEQVHLCLGFPGIAVGTKASYTMATINTILGGGMSSRLFQTIREERGLAYSVYSYHTGFVDTGLFTIYAALNPAQIGDVTELIFKEIHGMISDKINKNQLDKTKEQLKSNYILSLESVASRMNSIGRNLLMLDKVITADELIQNIDKVDLDTFYDLYEKVFKIDQVSLSIVGSTDFELNRG
ncbi:MAG: insulinase family protein [Defluviitaleaceae bacterium]|nr:insulinase family protein [Defluviitaleaceae bacterium]